MEKIIIETQDYDIVEHFALLADLFLLNATKYKWVRVVDLGAPLFSKTLVRSYFNQEVPGSIPSGADCRFSLGADILQ